MCIGCFLWFIIMGEGQQIDRGGNYHHQSTGLPEPERSCFSGLVVVNFAVHYPFKLFDFSLIILIAK